MIGLIEVNPTTEVKLPKTNKKQSAVKTVYMNKEEATKLLKAFEGEQLFPVVYMDLFYGLRRSEVIGLRWESIDFDNDTFEINHTIVQHKTLLEKDSTKSEESHAEFELLPQFKRILLKLKEHQYENRRLLGNAYNDTGYVFV